MSRHFRCLKLLLVQLESLPKAKVCLALGVAFAASALQGLAQSLPLANDWVVPGQVYTKVRVSRDGVYRLSSGQLPLGTVNPASIRVYHRGQEQLVYVEDAGVAGVWEGADFIEFIGRRQDGADDKWLYRNYGTMMYEPEAQANPHYSLFTDTSAYFITTSADARPAQFTFQNVGVEQYVGSNYAAIATNYPAASHCRFTSRTLFAHTYNTGDGPQFSPWFSSNSDFVAGEGFMSTVWQNTNAFVVTRHPATGMGGTFTLRGRTKGVPSNQDNSCTMALGPCSTTANYYGIEIQNIQLTCSTNALTGAAGGNQVTFSTQGDGRNRLAFAEIIYDRLFQFDNDTLAFFDWQNTQNADMHIHFDGFNTTGNGGYVYDLANRRRVRAVAHNGDLWAVMPKPNVGGLTSFVVANEGYLQQSGAFSSIEPASLAGISFRQGSDYVIITHRSLKASAEALEAYRDTATFDDVNSASIIYVDELFDEFGYGAFTPLALKRFIAFSLANWAVKPKYVMLWGKGRALYRGGGGGWSLVPTWGNPSSDMEFTMNFGLDTVDLRSQVAIGRVNAINDEMAFAYLNKLIEIETTPYDPWMKRGIHLGGGKQAGEQAAIGNYLAGIQEPIYEGIPYAGEIFYFQKQTNNVIGGQVFDADVRELVNDGVGVIQFFGHSSATVFEMGLQEPFSYQNKGKYPIIIANGCYGGDWAGVGGVSTLGESFTLYPDGGSIGYISTSAAGFVNYLGDHTTHMYEVAYRDSVRIPQGRAMSESNNRYCALGTQVVLDISNRASQCRTCNLQGDPAFRVYGPSLPDLEITASSITFHPDPFPSNIDSFTVQVDVRNHGLAVSDSFRVRVVQTVLSNGQVFSHDMAVVPSILNSAIVSVVCKTNGIEFPGLNRFEIMVDALTEIAELKENNNTVIIDKLVPSRLPVVLYPYDFAIVNFSQLTLRAGTFENSNRPISYIFEIDTNYKFTSPAKVNSGVIAGTAMSCQWQLPFMLSDSVVYYWRVRIDDGAEPKWADASFRYIQGPAMGWGQARYPQFLELQQDTLRMVELLQQWRFDGFNRSMRSRISAQGTYDFKFEIDNGAIAQTEPSALGVPGLFYSHIDGNTLAPLTNYNSYGNADLIFTQQGLMNLAGLVNAMQPGDYLFLAYRGGPGLQTPHPAVDPSFWPQTLWQALQTVGVTKSAISSLPSGNKFLLFGRKGNAPGTALLSTAPSAGSNGAFIELSTNLPSNFESGQIRSQLIGPATSWNDLIWNWAGMETTPGDAARVSVFGVKPDFSEVLLIADAGYTEPLNQIDPDTYPYLRLQGNMADPANRTAPQLRDWMVFFAPAPEAMWDPLTMFVFNRDTLNEGEMATARLAVRNISAYDMDSLLVHVHVREADNTLHTVVSQFYAPLPANAADTFDFAFSTVGLGGNCLATFLLNPGMQQPEQFLFNNVYAHPFHVKGDNRNPLLDVTFDGRRIMDGEVVAPSPNILIQANDENPYFMVDDPSLIQVYFRPMGAGQLLEQLAPTDPRLQFEPATNSENKARLYFRPQNLPDGTYELHAMVFDKAGNPSGAQPYKISFEVVNRSTVTNVVNYPNPFSTRTKFVYRLTGNELPDVFKLHIYTVSGRMVKVIDFVELGEVAVGQHTTAYEWDGTDEFGDRLANGVYLYRTEIRMPSRTNIERDQTGTEKFFEAGWGKMVLFR